MNYTKYLIQLYDGKGSLLVFYLLSWLLIVLLEKKKENKITFAYSAWYLPLLICNPAVGLLLEHFSIMPERIVRIYWLLPVSFVIAYGFTLLVSYAEKKIKYSGFFAATALCMLLILFGVPIVTEANYSLSQNIYKLPQVVVEVVDVLNQDYEKQAFDESEKMAIMPEALSTYARVYDSSWLLAYGRISETYEAGELYMAMGQPEIDVSDVLGKSRELGCSYMVLDTKKDLQNMPDEAAWEYLGESGQYRMYRIYDTEAAGNGSDNSDVPD